MTEYLLSQVQYLETSKQKELEQALSSGCTDTWQSVSIHGQVLSYIGHIMNYAYTLL